MALLKNGISKKNKITITVFLCIWAFFFYIFTRDYPNQQTEYEDFQQRRAQMEQQAQAEQQLLAAMTPEEIAAEKAAKEKAEQEAQAQRTKLEKEAKASKLLNDVKGYEGFLAQAEQEYKTSKASEKGLDDIRQALALFEGMADSLNEARLGKEALSKEDIAYLKDVEKRLSALQQKILPGLRLAFRKRAAQLLWEHDVAVSVSGAGNTAIKFTSAMFAANANIKTVQEQIGEIVMRLRFKQTRFEWYRDADEYTYYKLATPPDAKLAQFKFRQFVDLAAGYGK